MSGGIIIFAYHGCYDSEKKNGQNFNINIEYIPDSDIISIDDKINNTVDYTLLIKTVKEEFLSKRYNLLETIASKIVTKINIAFNLKFFKIQIQKTIEDNISIEIEKSNE